MLGEQRLPRHGGTDDDAVEFEVERRADGVFAVAEFHVHVAVSLEAVRRIDVGALDLVVDDAVGVLLDDATGNSVARQSLVDQDLELTAAEKSLGRSDGEGEVADGRSVGVGDRAGERVCLGRRWVRLMLRYSRMLILAFSKSLSIS